MEICKSHGADIAFDSFNCPACDEREQQEKTMRAANNEIDSLTEEVNELKDTVDRLEKIVGRCVCNSLAGD